MYKNQHFINSGIFLRVPSILMDDGNILLDECDMHKHVPLGQVSIFSKPVSRFHK